MQKRNLALSLLFLTVIVSGCADNGGKVSGQAITVQGPTVQPSEIFAGSSVRAVMTVINTGKLAGEVIIGEDGEQVMTDYCSDFFEINQFRSYSSRESDKTEYKLKPGERVQMNWELDQEGGNVPLNGYDCHVKFQVPFNYSVQAYQQFQVKSRDTETDVKLSSKTSQGPLSIGIETIGSSSQSGEPVFLERDNPEALFRIRNEQPEDSVFRGLIKVTDFKTGISKGELKNCNYDENKDITIDRNQMSDIIRCDITGIELNEVPSMRAELTAEANYTYVKEIGSRTVKVEYRGN